MYEIKSEVKWNQSVLDRIKLASNINSVEVGYPEDLTYPNGQKVSDVAWTQEFGTGRIPPRPFIRPTIASRGHHWYEKVRSKLFTAKNAEQFKAIYDDLGKAIQVNLKSSINKVSNPPLSDVTKKRRADKGNASDKPLVDTGTMRDSISYRVGKEGEWKK